MFFWKNQEEKGEREEKEKGEKKRKWGKEKREEMDFEGLKRDELTEQFLTVFQEFDFCDAQPQIEAPSVSLSVASTPPNSFSSQVCFTF